MSRPLSASLSLLLLAATVAAQNPGPLQIYPDLVGGGTSFFTRGTNPTPTAANEVLVQYPKTHFEGIGDSSVAGGPNNPVCRLSNWTVVIQDQNQKTAHTFGIVMRPAKSTGGPDTNNTNALYRISGTSPTATGTGPAAWRIWLVTPVTVSIPCKGDLFFGMAFTANTSWPTSDGLSTHTAYYDPIGQTVPSRKGDAVAPRTNVPNLAWEINASGVASQPTIPQVFDYGILSQYSMIQVGVRHKTGQSNHGTTPGANTDGFGVAGLYPSISGGANGRQDGALVRITDNPPGTAPTYGGRYILFLSLTTGTGLTIPPIQLNGLFGSVYLGPAGQIPLGGGNLSTAGPHTVILLAPPGAIPIDAAKQGVKVWFQAATTRMNSPVVAITNMAGVYY